MEQETWSFNLLQQSSTLVDFPVHKYIFVFVFVLCIYGKNNNNNKKVPHK